MKISFLHTFCACHTRATVTKGMVLNMYQDMVKILASCSLLAGSVGMGNCFVKAVQNDIFVLQKLDELLLLLKQEILYSHIPLPEACKRTAKRVASPFSEFLSGIQEEVLLRKGGSMEVIWIKQVEKLSERREFSKESIQVLMEMKGMLGCPDLEMQVKRIELERSRLQLLLQKKKEKEEGLSKLYRTAGILGGLLGTILFL